MILSEKEEYTSLETIKTLSPNGAPHKQSFDRQTDKCKRTDGLIDYL